MLRLSVVYAGLDATDQITPIHLDAASSLWRYCAASATYIFGAASGFPEADRLLRELIKALPKGLDGTQQQQLFGRHIDGARLATAREYLEERGLAVTEHAQTGGRPKLLTRAVLPACSEESEASEKSPGE
jgi:hypothetical protein